MNIDNATCREIDQTAAVYLLPFQEPSNGQMTYQPNQLYSLNLICYNYIRTTAPNKPPTVLFRNTDLHCQHSPPDPFSLTSVHGFGISAPTMKLTPIIPIVRRDPFDDPGFAYELKLDGYRGLADTISGKLLSKNLNHMNRFESLLNTLPENCVFDGEICALDSDGRPQFNDLL